MGMDSFTRFDCLFLLYRLDYFWTVKKNISCSITEKFTLPNPSKCWLVWFHNTCSTYVVVNHRSVRAVSFSRINDSFRFGLPTDLIGSRYDCFLFIFHHHYYVRSVDSKDEICELEMATSSRHTGMAPVINTCFIHRD